MTNKCEYSFLIIQNKWSNIIRDKFIKNQVTQLNNIYVKKISKLFIL